MPTIVYQRNVKGIKYAYESTSYWDKDKKRSRTKRRYIGRVDPETGEIIPSKSRNHDSKDANDSTKVPCECNADDLCDEIRARDTEIKSLKEQLEVLGTANEVLLDKLGQIVALVTAVDGGVGRKEIPYEISRKGAGRTEKA